MRHRATEGVVFSERRDGEVETQIIFTVMDALKLKNVLGAMDVRLPSILLDLTLEEEAVAKEPLHRRVEQAHGM